MSYRGSDVLWTTPQRSGSMTVPLGQGQWQSPGQSPNPYRSRSSSQTRSYHLHFLGSITTLIIKTLSGHHHDRKDSLSLKFIIKVHLGNYLDKRFIVLSNWEKLTVAHSLFATKFHLLLSFIEGDLKRQFQCPQGD